MVSNSLKFFKNMASEQFEAIRNSDTSTTVWCVYVNIPESLEFSEKEFCWSTLDNVELEDGNTYRKMLVNPPACRHQRDRGNDYAEFTIFNKNNALHAQLFPFQDYLETAKVIIRECYQIDLDYFESEIVWYGFIKDFSLNDADKTIQFNCISDMSRDNRRVSSRVMTRERCGTNFSFGLLPSDAKTPCTWQTSQGGNPNYCSKFYTGIDGCEAHNNTHQFYAVTGLSNAVVEVTPNLQGYLGGFDYRIDECFTANTLVLMADGTCKPINKIKAGEYVLAFDVFDNDKIVISKVNSVSSKIVNEILITHFNDGIFETTAGEMFYLGSQQFAQITNLIGKTVQSMDKDKNVLKSHLLDTRVSIEIASVHNLETEHSTFMVTDRFEKIFKRVHNQKAFVDYSVYNGYSYNYQ